jgi:hypothetical protein
MISRQVGKAIGIVGEKTQYATLACSFRQQEGESCATQADSWSTLGVQNLIIHTQALVERTGHYSKTRPLIIISTGAFCV